MCCGHWVPAGMTVQANIGNIRRHSITRDRRPVLFGAVLALMMLAQVLGEGGDIVIQLSSFVVLIVLALIILSYKPTNSVPGISWFIFIVFFFLMFISNWIGIFVVGSAAFIRVAAISSFLLVGVLLSYRLEHRILERALPSYAIGLALVLVFVLVDNDRQFERLRGHLHSNLWGYLAATIMPIVALSRIRLIIKVLAVSFLIYLLAFEFQARAALAWAVAGLIVFIPLQAIIKAPNRSVKAAVLFVTFFGSVLLALLAFVFSDWILTEVFKVGSASRGFGSGLTGRTGLWNAALDVFLERPIFGHGFDSGRYYASNFFFVYAIGKIESLHSSYITVFFEMGIVGGSWYLLIIGVALAGAFSSKDMVLASFLLIYLAMGLTETRQMNIANSSGILFVILLPYLSTKLLLNQKRRLP